MVIHCCKFIYTRWGARAMTIGQLTLVFVSPLDYKYEQTLNHEAIHRAQFRECGGFFKLWKIYRADRKYLMKTYSYDKRTASRLTRFEREAYDNAPNKYYLKTREIFQWIKYKI